MEVVIVRSYEDFGLSRVRWVYWVGVITEGNLVRWAYAAQTQTLVLSL